MEIIYHGHSCVQINNVIIDPWISDNPMCKTKLSDIKVDYILLTHGHNDHVGDTFELAQQNDALVISNVEIAEYFEELGLKTFGMQPGGQFEFDFGKVKMTPAIHGSSYTQADGVNVPLGLAVGFIVTIDDNRIYHAGDTALFSDMKLIKDIDVAFVPIGDVYTMGIEDAAECVKWLQPKIVVPIHYNTFDLIKANVNEFKNMLKATKVVALGPGERLNSL